MVGIATVGVLLAGQTLGTLRYRQVQDLVPTQPGRACRARHGPGPLSGDRLLGRRVAQVRLGVENASVLKALPLRGGEPLPEGRDQLSQGIRAGPAVDHVVGAVVGIVSARSEGEAGALAFPLELRDQPAALGQSNREQTIRAARTLARQLTGQDDGPRALTRVLHPVLGADQGPVAAVLGHHPIQDPLQGLA